jgi:hypothetical protein
VLPATLVNGTLSGVSNVQFRSLQDGLISAPCVTQQRSSAIVERSFLDAGIRIRKI